MKDRAANAEDALSARLLEVFTGFPNIFHSPVTLSMRSIISFLTYFYLARLSYIQRRGVPSGSGGPNQ